MYARPESFADFYQNYRNLSYDRLAYSRGFDGNEEKLELVKKLREMGKDAVKKINRQYFFTSPEIMAEHIQTEAVDRRDLGIVQQGELPL